MEPLLTYKTFIVQHHQYTIITSVYSLQVTPYSMQHSGYTSVCDTYVLKIIIIVIIDGNISITSLCYHFITTSYHNIIIISNISINILINIIMFNIIAYITISLCFLTSHVTTTCVNTTNTGWLHPHNATTK